MASEDSRGTKTTVDLPDDVYDWLAEEALDGDDAETVARRLLDVHRRLASDVGAGTERPVTEAELDERVDELDARLEDLIEDVRKRVLQLKRETDARAPVDHEHEDLRERLDELERRADEARDEAETASDRAEAVESSLSTGFENYEEILSYLTQETDRLADRLDLLARATIDLRSAVETIAGERASHDAVDELKRAANQQGVRTAECEACSASIDIALLADPTCPQCAERLVDVTPGTRFFRSAVLETGDPPALSGGDASDDLGAAIDAAFEEDSPDPPKWEPPGEHDE